MKLDDMVQRTNRHVAILGAFNMDPGTADHVHAAVGSGSQDLPDEGHEHGQDDHDDHDDHGDHDHRHAEEHHH